MGTFQHLEIMKHEEVIFDSSKVVSLEQKEYPYMLGLEPHLQPFKKYYNKYSVWQFIISKIFEWDPLNLKPLNQEEHLEHP